MRAEIGDIPTIVAGLLAHGDTEIARVALEIRRRQPGVVVIAARGTSDHAGIYARYLLEAYLGLPVVLAASSLATIYGRSMSWTEALVIGISQSGEAPDVAAVLVAARHEGAATVALTNTPGSLLERVAELTLPCSAGPELAVAATKTYVAELAVLAALVAELARHAGRQEEVTDLASGLPAVPSVLSRTLEASVAWVEQAEGLVEAMAASDRALIVSRGYNYATALEVALKLKETSRMFADGYSTADLLHGPLALAGPAVPLVVFRPDGPMGFSIDETVERARKIGAQPWIVGGRELDQLDGRHVALPIDLPDSLSPLAFALPGQLLAERVARRRGMDPDAPPALTKVTRTL